jgi:hypothetical protein
MKSLSRVSDAIASGAESAAGLADRAWGLTGTWKMDCKQQPHASNITLFFSIARGKTEVTYDAGPHYQKTWAITGVQLSPNDRIEVTTIEHHGHGVLTTYERHRDGRIRPFQSLRVGTEVYSIKDGLLLSSGRPYPWMTRCDVLVS